MLKRPAQIKDELKKAYQTIAKDFSASRSRHWPEFKILARAIPAGSKVLDLGCGNGRFYRYLAEQGKAVDFTGVDFSGELLAIAKKAYPKQEFIEQDITALELPRRFDRIVCVAAFHHIPSKKLRKKTLKLISEHLEDDGMFLVSVWNLWQWKYLGCFLRSLLRTILSGFRSDPRDLDIPFGKEKILRYYHAFMPLELRRLLQKAGFMIEHAEISGHNSLFLCRKNISAVTGQAIFVDSKKLAVELSKSSAVAACKTLSP